MDQIDTQTKESLSWTELRELIEKTSLQMQETDRRMQETDRRMQETDRQMQETDRRMQETDRQIQETSRLVAELRQHSKELDQRIEAEREESRKQDEKYRELADQFTSTTGHITEGIMKPATVRIFKDAGFDIDRYCCNLKKKNKNKQEEMEVDFVMLNGTLAIVVEVKTECRRKDIDHFLRQLPKFKRLFPEYRDKEILAAVAALSYDRDAAEYAHEQGLLVITTADGNLFELEPFERNTLKRF